MVLHGNIISLLIVAVVLYNGAAAAPYVSTESYHNRRQDSDPNAGSNPAVLEPVIPPDINPDVLTVLAQDAHVTLAWAGSTQPSSANRLLKRESAVLSQAQFTFKYPSVPLDHSDLVFGVSCSGGAVSGTLTSTAYKFAKQQWSGVSDILFITSVDGCGQNQANYYFRATSITFTDSSLSFSAAGSPVTLGDVSVRMSLKWGNLGTQNVARGIDKRQMFEPLLLHKRVYGYADWDFSWASYVDAQTTAPKGFPKAPWKNASLIAYWDGTGGTPDNSYSQGQVATKGHYRRSDETSLSPRGLNYGLAFYCVQCGFQGKATLWGEIETSYLSIVTARVGVKASFKAGVSLGLYAFVKYKKTSTTTLAKIPLPYSFQILGVVDIGPFIKIAVKTELTINASGQLLLGAGVSWDNIDVLLDLVDDSQSYARGLVPKFVPVADASGKLSVQASLGLPVSVGVGLTLDAFLFEWTGEAAIVDTPKIVAVGKFSVSGSMDANGNFVYKVGGNSCYGIAWDIHFENTLQAVLRAGSRNIGTIDLITPYKSDPLAQGCIGYINDGSDSDDDPLGSGSGTGGNGLSSGGNGLSGGSGGGSSGSSGSSGSGGSGGSAVPLVAATSSTAPAAVPSSTTAVIVNVVQPTTTTPTTTTTSVAAPPSPTTTTTTTTRSTTTTTTTTTTRLVTTTTSTRPACTASTVATVNAATPTGLTCKSTINQARVATTLNVGQATTVGSVDLCAINCLKNTQCLSFGFSSQSQCQIYNKAVKNLGVTTRTGSPTITFYDKQCYVYNTCPK